MRIGIDISQTAYEGTGVGEFVKKLVENFINSDDKNEYILFFSSMRRKFQISNLKFQNNNAKYFIKEYPFPPRMLDFLWNKLHIIPIEKFIGDVDVFISSDWTQPPVKKAKNATILYDLIVYKYPEETAHTIIETQKRRLRWVKKETDMVICISDATKKDAMEILGLPEDKLSVVYPGI